MKTLLIAVCTLFISTGVMAQDAEVIRLSEPVQQTDAYEVFGAEVDTWDTAIELSELINAPEDFTDKVITIETEIAEVCEKKGCFFVANAGSESARITFKDYGFFIPTDSKGKTVKLIGNFEVKELTEEEAKHYAEDAGQDPDKITGPQKEYSIVATSVLVPKS
ncbi:DUF4920 domain-containing protein [Gracilimonas amylolytica]|uniref:DUF4920 domain-containing protein n=1 Tax=Gracilimonas amylolytica TaxID=1749045 RepID=UPI000CD937BA|nr:DUF4920 domain-containing protein [Gracilimonas amylolytica]